MQKLVIAGRVGKDAELRSTPTGDKVLNFSVAVSNGKDKDATWYDASIWGKRGEAVSDMIKKGDAITLFGRPTARVHDGKVYMGIMADDFTFQGGKAPSQGDTGGYDSKPQGQAGGAYAGGAYDNMSDEIPFNPQFL